MHISNAESKINLYNKGFDGFSSTSKAIQSLEQSRESTQNQSA